MRTRTIAAILGVVIIIIAIAGVAFFLTLQPPQVESVSVRSVDSVSSSGLNLTFAINLYNPNVVGVNIKSVTYNLLLVDGNQVLGTGTIDGIQVPAHGSFEVLIPTHINFKPVVSAAFQTIFTKSVLMNINGVVTAHPVLVDISVPFDHTFDAYPYISNTVSRSS